MGVEFRATKRDHEKSEDLMEVAADTVVAMAAVEAVDVATVEMTERNVAEIEMAVTAGAANATRQLS